MATRNLYLAHLMLITNEPLEQGVQIMWIVNILMDFI